MTAEEYLPAESDLAFEGGIMPPDAPVIGSFFFTLRDTECNSKVFGDCEICGKPVVQVFHQKRFQIVIHPLRKEIYQKFISDSYGHRQCLESLR